VTQHIYRARKRQHLQNLLARVTSLERENIRLSQKVAIREAELRQMQNGSSVQCGGISQLRLNQCLTLLCARLLTICFTLCSDSRSVQLPFNICHQASAACRQGFLVLSLLASMSFGIGTDKVLQEEQPVAMEDAPTSPRAIYVQPAASALPHIYCRVASAQSSKHPLLPSESSPEVSLRSISVQDKATVQHSSSDAQSASRDIEPMAAGQHHAPSISVVQGSMPGDEVRCAPAASYNIVTSGEYASAIEHETTVSIAPGNPLSAPPHAHLISDEITGSYSSQELPQHYSKQQDFFQTLSELQDLTCLRAICHQDTHSLPGQPRLQPGGNNDDNFFCADFQQAQHAFPEYDIGNKSVRDSSSWSRASADADSFQHRDCLFEQDGTLTVASLPSASWKQQAWHESCQQQQHQLQQVRLSSSVQDAPAQGSTEWEPMLFKTVAMTTSMDDMSGDGFVAEASRWIVQNCGSHIPTESFPSAGKLQLPCMHMFDQGQYAYLHDSVPVHHCACCIALSFAR